MIDGGNTYAGNSGTCYTGRKYRAGTRWEAIVSNDNSVDVDEKPIANRLEAWESSPEHTTGNYIVTWELFTTGHVEATGMAQGWAARVAANNPT